MHKTTSPRRKKFRLLAFASATLLTIGAVAALAAGVTPATAATLAAQPDTQIAVFMVPLTILVVAILYEVARIALRGTLPEQATPLRRRAHRRWSDGQHAG
jgi:membrane protein implicated in regulation of membrane protease activity